MPHSISHLHFARQSDFTAASAKPPYRPTLKNAPPSFAGATEPSEPDPTDARATKPMVLTVFADAPATVAVPSAAQDGKMNFLPTCGRP